MVGAGRLAEAALRADELITTIMLYYVAIDLCAYLLHGPLQEPQLAAGADGKT